jgi:AcrB/AcrD/AcrF family
MSERFVATKKLSQSPANLAVFGDHKRSISKDTLQFERVFASRFVPRRIFGPRVWGDTNLLRHMC